MILAALWSSGKVSALRLLGWGFDPWLGLTKTENIASLLGTSGLDLGG